MEAILGLLFYGLGAVLILWGGSRIIEAFTHRNDPPNIRHCTGVCIPDRSNMLTGAYTDDSPAYGRGDWQPDQQAAGQTVREVSTSTGYNARPGDTGKRAPMTAPQHGEEWDYPVEIPQPQPERIPAPNWPVRVKR